jgi:hypothetical protein
LSLILIFGLKVCSCSVRLASLPNLSDGIALPEVVHLDIDIPLAFPLHLREADNLASSVRSKGG